MLRRPQECPLVHNLQMPIPHLDIFAALSAFPVTNWIVFLSLFLRHKIYNLELFYSCNPYDTNKNCLIFEFFTLLANFFICSTVPKFNTACSNLSISDNFIFSANNFIYVNDLDSIIKFSINATSFGFFKCFASSNKYLGFLEAMIILLNLFTL